MADAALSLSALLASVPSTTALPDAAAASATATPADPFAALFAAVGQAATAIVPKPPAPVALPVVPGTPPLPAAAEAALPVTETIDETSNSKDEDEDPLGNAIASGATAVLALAPAIVPPAPPAPTILPTPIAIAPPVTATIPVIGSGAPAFKPARGPRIDQPAATDAAVDTAVPATATPVGQAASPAYIPARAETDDRGERQTPPKPAAQAKPVAAALSPEMVKAVVASLQPSAAAPASADPVAIADPMAAAAAPPMPDATAKAEQRPPATQVVQRQAAPVLRSGDDGPEPRRAGTDTRKRAAPVDTAPIGLVQRTDGATRPVSGDGAIALQDKGDTIVQHTLAVAKDGAWLDSLTRDIVNSAGSGNDLHFKLEPQTLGSLTVAIRQSTDGASIRMTADTDTTRNILLDAQPKLIAEARAQGLKVSDTQVDLGNQHQSSSQDASRWAQGNPGQNGTGQNGQNRQSSPAHQPFVSNLGRNAEVDAESPSGDSDALYA